VPVGWCGDDQGRREAEGAAVIQVFVDRWRADTSRPFRAHPDSYQDLVRKVVEVIGSDSDDYTPDPDRIHEIDDGEYQGTLVYVIGATSYQPSVYWFVRVGYGSCSGCDTLEAIRGYSDEPPTEQQEKDYMTLALHVVEGLRLMGGE
jgi:hypothetical protein